MDVGFSGGEETARRATSETAQGPCIFGDASKEDQRVYQARERVTGDVAGTGGTKGLQVFAGRVRNPRRGPTFFFSSKRRVFSVRWTWRNRCPKAELLGAILFQDTLDKSVYLRQQLRWNSQQLFRFLSVNWVWPACICICNRRNNCTTFISTFIWTGQIEERINWKNSFHFVLMPRVISCKNDLERKSTVFFLTLISF